MFYSSPDSFMELSSVTYPVIIVDYDPMWSILYEEEKSQILRAIGHKALEVEHIGSTAVSGLGSKPIIDIMAGIHRSVDADECVSLLQSFGYDDVTPITDNSEWYYCLGKEYRGETSSLEYYHLHLVKFMSEHWKKHLIFRDFLRSHSKVAQQYCEMKKKIAAKYGSDRVSYTASKTKFIESVVAQARLEKNNY